MVVAQAQMGRRVRRVELEDLLEICPRHVLLTGREPDEAARDLGRGQVRVQPDRFFDRCHRPGEEIWRPIILSIP